jgi:hypothetical protein
MIQLKDILTGLYDKNLSQVKEVFIKIFIDHLNKKQCN